MLDTTPPLNDCTEFPPSLRTIVMCMLPVAWSSSGSVAIRCLLPVCGWRHVWSGRQLISTWLAAESMTTSFPCTTMVRVTGVACGNFQGCRRCGDPHGYGYDLPSHRPMEIFKQPEMTRWTWDKRCMFEFCRISTICYFIVSLYFCIILTEWI